LFTAGVYDAGVTLTTFGCRACTSGLTWPADAAPGTVRITTIAAAEKPTMAKRLANMAIQCMPWARLGDRRNYCTPTAAILTRNVTACS
jgi:hypothetical protein